MAQAAEQLSGKHVFTGNTGEYLVVGELLRRGIVAALAPRNTPDFDVLATRGDRSANIRVKTKSPASKSWVWRKHADGSVFGPVVARNDFLAVVDLPKPPESPKYFIVTTKEMDALLTVAFENWKTTPGMNGKPHSADNWERRFGYEATHHKQLGQHENDWQVITDFLNGGTR